MQEEEEAGALPDHLRCKRTDGKQWRCNRRVMDDKKLCEIHHLQGRHRQYRQKVPESLKLQRKSKKIFKVQRNPVIRAQKFKKLKKKKKKRVIGESEALDEAVKKMKLKRGDLQLELIRMVLKREVEKRKKRKESENGDDENFDNSDSDSDTEFTRALPNGLMAVSTIYSGTNSDNAGSSCAVKIGAESAAVTRRCFRSKNIEPVPVGTLQVVPYKRDVVSLRRRKKCHWCRRRNSSLIKCSSCRKLFFCLDCIKERYFDTQEEVKKACPVCRGACGCKACSSSQCRDFDYKDSLRDKNEVDKVLHFHYLICMLLPVLKQINEDQSIELEIEAKIKDQKPTEIQIQQAEYNHNKQCCCSCQTYITDFHRSCVNCSYLLCLSCCRDILEGSTSGSIGDLISKSPDGRKASTSGARLSGKKSIRTYEQSYGSTYFVSSASLLSQKTPDGSVGISCPSIEFGGCGDNLLNLKCIFPFSWIKELEISAEQIVGCYELPEMIDISSSCSLCLGMDQEAKGIKQLQKVAARESSLDNFLYHPTVRDIQGDKLEHFQKHWGKGHPVIVRNVLRGTSLSWDPIVMFCTYLKNSSRKSENDEGATKDTDCMDWFEVEIGIRQLFLGSVRGQKCANMCDEKLKLKGWLSSHLFQEQFPDHYAEIIHSLPLPEYMDPESGVLNIASKLPEKTPKLDLGPCVYISYGSGEELVQADSVTKLCYDLCDVVNILAHTTDVPVSTKQLNNIRELMKKHKGQDEMDATGVAPELKVANKTKGKSSLNGEDVEEAGACNMVGEEVTRLEASDLNPKDRNNYDDGEYDTDSDSSMLCCGSIQSLRGSDKGKIVGDHTDDSSYYRKERKAASCGAQWDVFRREDVPKLIEYLRKHSHEFTRADRFHKHVVHPIFDQNFFLDSTHKMRLKEEFEIEPWTFEQHVGEAVIIPAGCPYQIKNLKSCVNVVLDFVSPESVSECIRLIDELRLLPYDHKAKGNKLEVKKMALYGISTAIKGIRELTCAE